jgi:hypothetical protein
LAATTAPRIASIIGTLSGTSASAASMTATSVSNSDHRTLALLVK